jgi:hypothetical protein
VANNNSQSTYTHTHTHPHARDEDKRRAQTWAACDSGSNTAAIYRVISENCSKSTRSFYYRYMYIFLDQLVNVLFQRYSWPKYMIFYKTVALIHCQFKITGLSLWLVIDVSTSYFIRNRFSELMRFEINDDCIYVCDVITRRIYT